MKNIYKSVAVSTAVLSVLSAARPTTIICEEIHKLPVTKEIVKEVVTYTSKDSYDMLKSYYAKSQISNKISKKINIDKQIIEYAFEEAEIYVDLNDNYTMKDYYEIVSVILATMEVESSFEQNLVCSNVTSVDYGIMQVNSLTVKDMKKVLGSSINDYKYDIKQNIKAGTYEAMLCWEKAKEKHPDDVPFYSYAYYNRGLYYEGRNFNVNERNKRSSKFKNVYYKYFDICNNCELVIN